MNLQLRSHATLVALAAAVLLCGAAVRAQEDGPPPPGGPPHGPPPPREHRERGFWIGLRVNPAGEDGAEGLVVEDAVPDGPAAKAGIKPGDVITKAGDRPLRRLRDLIDSIASSDGKPVALAIKRGDETKTIDVTPGHRPDEIEPLPGEPEVRRLINRARELAPGLADRLARDFVVFRPGLPMQVEFPKDLKVAINKEGDQPAKVTVERGDKKWEVTDKTLGELPDEVRGYVELYLGKPPTPPLPKELENMAFNIHVPPPPGLPEDVERHLRREARRLQDEAGPRVRELQDRLEGLERRLQERLRDVEKRIENLDREPRPDDGKI